MSDCITKVEKILKVEVHPNADRLSLATVRGWNCVIPKDVYKEGDLCVYIPIDSILPESLEEKIFSGSKVKLSKHRVKTIKLRGAISQGLIANLNTIDEYLKNDGKKIKLKEGADITEALGIVKHEPPAPKFQNSNSGRRASQKQVNPLFSKYTNLQNIKNYPNLFKDEDMIIATEKIHGTNFRAGWVPFNANTNWKKIKKFFGFAPEWEFVYGSHNVQLQHKSKTVKAYYEGNVYYQMVKKYKLEEIIGKGCVFYGEIYGDGIQKNYNYGLINGEKDLVIFDMKMHSEHQSEGVWANYDIVKAFCKAYGLKMVPELFCGHFKDLNVEELFEGVSKISDEQKVREGFVVGSLVEENTYAGRKKLKVINPEYLLQKGNTDFH